MGDLKTQCAKNVVLEVVREDGEVDRSTLKDDLVLRKEIGNARLVSGDCMLWVGKSVLSHKDSTMDSRPVRTVCVENGKRRFIFTLVLDVEGKQFYTELKEQAEGKAGVAIRKKKRKIRKQLSQVMGFTPTNTLKSPMKSPLKSPAKQPPSTPKRSPLASIRSPQLSLPPPLPLTSAGTTVAPSPSRSPFRSPFRKKARLSQSPSSGRTPLAETKPTTPSSRSPVREWLSPVRALKLRSGSTPPDMKRHTPDKASTGESGTGEGHRRKSITGGINKRVRSLQLMLDEEPSAKQAIPAPVEPLLKPTVTSHFFKKKTPTKAPADTKPAALDTSMEVAGAEGTAQSENETTAELGEGEDKPKDSAVPVDGAPSAEGPQRSTHGLLNLGNYCYMNSIIQSLAALPAFVDGVQDEESLLKIIRMQPHATVKSKSLEQLKASFDAWRTSGDEKHLALQYTLGQLLQQVIRGSETSINPEPLKNLMGRKNAIFATHFQQDAHEFLLNLVTEYEQELVKTVREVTNKIVEENKTPPHAPTGNLMSFFRSAPKGGDALKDKRKEKTTEDDHELICRLPPAKCFRAELNRTLTCSNCGYSRKQTETFYDFSLDLPYYPVPELAEPSAEQEPQQESQEPLPPPQCFCNLDAIVQTTATAKFYGCPKSSCSFREKVVDEGEPESAPATPVPNAAMMSPPPSTQTTARSARVQSIDLETLIQKQFESEILELTCEKCKVGKEAESAYQVKSLPSVLVLHLKRFEVNPHTGALYKRSDPVVAPASIDPVHTINNSAPSGNEARYTLKSVVHHLGKSIDEGHYVADVCDADGRWIRRNDTHESVISEDYALRAYRSQESCYMLFYVKSESRTLTGGDKENVPLNRIGAADDNDENAAQQQQKGGGESGSGAFL